MRTIVKNHVLDSTATYMSIFHSRYVNVYRKSIFQGSSMAEAADEALANVPKNGKSIEDIISNIT